MDRNSFANFFDEVGTGKSKRYNLCRNMRFDNVDSIDPSLYEDYVVTER